MTNDYFGWFWLFRLASPPLTRVIEKYIILTKLAKKLMIFMTMQEF